MTDTIFMRWRITLTFLFLDAEVLWLTAQPSEPYTLLPTLALAPAILFPAKSKARWLLTYLPALWLLGTCTFRLSRDFSGHGLTALHPALCGAAFLLVCVQIARHGRHTLYQWSFPVAWLVLSGILLCLLLGWPEADDLWYLLLLLIAEFGRCAALIDLLK